MYKMTTVLAGLGSAALLATTGMATAGASPTDGWSAGGKISQSKTWTCTKGAFCAYTGTNGGGTRHERFADTNKNITGINSLRNNGDTSEALDHVKIKWNNTGESTSHWACYAPGQQASGTPSITVDAIRWVSSC